MCFRFVIIILSLEIFFVCFTHESVLFLLAYNHPHRSVKVGGRGGGGRARRRSGKSVARAACGGAFFFCLGSTRGLKAQKKGGGRCDYGARLSLSLSLSGRGWKKGGGVQGPGGGVFDTSATMMLSQGWAQRTEKGGVLFMFVADKKGGRGRGDGACLGGGGSGGRGGGSETSKKGTSKVSTSMKNRSPAPPLGKNPQPKDKHKNRGLEKRWAVKKNELKTRPHASLRKSKERIPSFTGWTRGSAPHTRSSPGHRSCRRRGGRGGRPAWWTPRRRSPTEGESPG